MWLAPALLLGLLSVALPLWLHRFARRTDERRPFASLMLIEAGEVRRSRRRQLRYWLLLALRLALLVLLVLALAGPQWPRQAGGSAAVGAHLHLLVLDTSLSMQRGEVWPRARQQALDILDGLRGDDRVLLAVADHQLQVLHPAVFAGDAGPLRALVRDLTPGQSRLDFGRVMSGAASLSEGTLQAPVLHLITDLQASGSPLHLADLQPPPGMALDLVDVSLPDVANQYIESVQWASGTAGAIDVTVGGDLPLGRPRELRLLVDGVERGRRALDPSRQSPYVERFVIDQGSEGEHRATAVLSPGDALPGDDALHRVLRRVEPRVLVVAANAAGDDASYLRAALAALQDLRLRVEVVDVATLARRRLADYAVIAVTDAGLLDATQAKALQSFAQDGGGVLLALGDRARSPLPVVGGRAGTATGAAGAAQALRIAEVDDSHPALRQAGDWRALRFFRHVPLQLPEATQVLLRLEGGDPLLVQQQPGRGRVLLLASALDRQWNDLALHPQFVGFLAEATAWLAGERGRLETATVGNVLTRPLTAGTGVQVFSPDGRRAPLLDSRSDELRLVPVQAGFYELRGGGRSQWLAVNTDPRESALRRLDAARQQQWQQMVVPAATPLPGTTATAAPGWVPVWFWLLLLAALLAMIEPLVANAHLGIRREQTT